MDYDRISERVFAGMMQGFVVAFVGLAAFLPASYIMNRYIYRTRSMRTFMGILAALMGMGALVILLIMRAYTGETMKVHYFGMLPFLTEKPAETGEISYVMWIINGIWSLFLLPLTFYYTNDKADKDGYESTVIKMLDNFKTGDIHVDETSNVRMNAVSEDLFALGRELAALPMTDYEKVGSGTAISETGNLQALQEKKTQLQQVGKKLFATS